MKISENESSPLVFIIDDDQMMAECIARACKCKTHIFHNAIEAVDALNQDLPDLIFLDILLDGPDGFTFLNETVSYSDTAKIPVVIVSSLDFKNKDLTDYGVIGVLNKDTMTPEEIYQYVKQVTK